jgi:hypothetical protein
VDVLEILGTGGAIGGAICGAILGIFDGKAAMIIGGMIGGIGGCILVMVGGVFGAVSWPSPQPYPGAQPLIGTGVGSWGTSRSQIYTVTLRLEDVQRYYEGQMNRQCESAWRFRTLSDPAYSLCLEAHCKIHRPLLEQDFSVRLCRAAEKQTVVAQVDLEQD